MNSIYLSDNWLSFIEDAFGWKAQQIKLGNNLIPVIIKRRFNLTKCASTLPFAHHLPDLPIDETATLKSHLKNLGVRDFNYHGRIVNPEVKLYSENTIIKIDLKKFATPELLFQSLNKDSIQRKIRKAEQAKIKIELLTSENDYARFQEIQSATRKRQGAPTYPVDFFLKLRKHLGTSGMANLFGVYNCHGKLVSGIITFNHLESAIYAYGASDVTDRLYSAGANQLCMWASIKHAMRTGTAMFDFGSTPKHHLTLTDYKLKWASEKNDLIYSYYSLDGSNVPAINRQSTSIAIIESLIKRMPDALFKRTTPYLLRLAVS